MITCLKVEFSGKESPSELFAQEQGITAVGELGEVTSLRKVDISFNPISSLDKIQQLNQLRHLSAYCCRLQDIECLAG
jgi:Leucine-rich repeat (LRR) protein